MSEKLIFNCTYGKEEPERATLPFVAANIAATAGQDAVVLCTIEAVWLGTVGGTDGIARPGLPVLDDLYQEFVENGGTVWICGACAKNCPVTAISVQSGVGCVTAIIRGAIRGTEPDCDCAGNSTCC